MCAKSQASLINSFDSIGFLRMKIVMLNSSPVWFFEFSFLWSTLLTCLLLLRQCTQSCLLWTVGSQYSVPICITKEAQKPHHWNWLRLKWVYCPNWKKTAITFLYFHRQYNYPYSSWLIFSYKDSHFNEEDVLISLIFGNCSWRQNNKKLNEWQLKLNN